MVGATKHYDPDRRYAIKVKRGSGWEWLVIPCGKWECDRTVVDTSLTTDARWLRTTYGKREATRELHALRNAGTEARLVRITYVTVTPSPIQPVQP